MKNIRICPNCNSENHFIDYTCQNCQHYMRDKVVNINVWSEFWNLLESPTESFKNIILAEHKNYTIFLLLFISVKLALNSIIVNTGLGINQDAFNYLVINLSIYSGVFIILFVLAAIIINVLVNKIGVKSRFKNIFAVITYSFWPLAFGLLILTSVEAALFGTYFFSFNPSPFVLKPGASYIIFILEGVFLLASFFYLIIGVHSVTASKIFSVIVALIFISAICAVSLFLPSMPL